MTEIEYPWYGLVEANSQLSQGDLFKNLPVIQPDISTIDTLLSKPDVDEQKGVYSLPGIQKDYNVVVMTQSCDLLDLSSDNMVTLCARYNISVATTSKGDSVNNAEGWGKLIRGSYVGLHLLNQCDNEGHEFEYQIVDLQRIFNVPFGFLDKFKEAHGTRVRLNPPYREHLGQAFARQFMRVGLPLDLPRKFPG